MSRFLVALAVSCCLVGGAACSDSGPQDAKYWGKKLIKDPKLREQALSELKKFKDPASVPDLVEALKIDGDHRADVAFLLGEFKDKSAVQPLIQGIDFAVGAGRDKESKEKNRANTKIAESLGKLGDPAAVEPLSKLLKSRDQYVQLAAVRALGLLKAPQAVDALMDIAENNENNFMIKNAIMSLGDIGDPKAIPLLTKMMFFERGVSFYREASYALFQFGKDAVQPLLDAYEGKNEQIASMKLDPAVAPAKVAVVLGDIGDPRGLPRSPPLTTTPARWAWGRWRVPTPSARSAWSATRRPSASSRRACSRSTSPCASSRPRPWA
jgi:HEAT repeat protein